MKARKMGLAAMFVGVMGFVLCTGAVADETKEVNLQVGDDAPLFAGTDDGGEAWKLDDHVGKQFVVLYFYPADFTTGCTRQAVAWRDNMNALKDAGVQVVGVSADSVKNHKLFKDAWTLNYTLLADEEAQIAKAYGVPLRPAGRAYARGPDRQRLLDENGDPIVLKRKATFMRWTFVIGENGTIVYKNTRVRPHKDSQQVLEFVQKAQSDAAN